MEFLVEKIGMSRTIAKPSIPVTLLKVKQVKVCEVLGNNRAIVSYQQGKTINKSIMGQQKKYSLSKEFNRFMTIDVSNTEAGDLDLSGLESAKRVKVSFNTKGRGFSGVMKRWNFQGGPGAHGSRFHRAPGSIGNREWPGRVQPGKKMAGHYGNEKVTVQNEIVSFDKEQGVLVLKGSVPGFNGAFGKIKVVK
ncbi:50S ribosomal protein L3 [Helicobacter ibis]|uniref:50S ribosomal protein L3 n=1 Tax=Helicobacter ibis TaxID=2962633 RepID=A0ABT4VBW3_9HELI|nr:50S ribosomal protein L3 [Helicobacter ibis]MDA3968194.1 50S ribosomal protein L3 [Helicobacter ibis]